MQQVYISLTFQGEEVYALEFPANVKAIAFEFDTIILYEDMQINIPRIVEMELHQKSE